MRISKFVHVFPTWEVYPRVFFFRKRFIDVYLRFNNIINKRPYASLLCHSPLLDQLKDLRIRLENNLEICVFAEENIEKDSLVVTTEPLKRSSKDITLSNQQKIEEPAIRVVVANAKINSLEQEGLKDVVDTVQYLLSSCGQTAHELSDKMIVVCHTDIVFGKADQERLNSSLIEKLRKSFGIVLTATRIIYGTGALDEKLSREISLIVETQIVNGFFSMKVYLQSILQNKNLVGSEKSDIVESDQLMNAMQNFLRNSFGLLDMLADSQTTDEPFIETVLRHLTRSIRCAILDPLSSKFNMKQEICNQIAHEEMFEKKLKDTVSRNTRHHLGKLQQALEDSKSVMKTGRRQGFPVKKFMFIAYPLREDIRPTILELEQVFFKRKVNMIKRMVFEINGNIQQSIVQRADDVKKTKKPKVLSDELRKHILSVEGVYGIGTFYGEVEVHVNTDADKQWVIEQMNTPELDRQVHVKKIIERPKVIAGRQVEQGCVLESQIPGEEIRFKAGTLGAFADDINHCELYALTCAHVVNNTREEQLVYMKNGTHDRKPFATSRQDRMVVTGTDPCPLIDFAAVKVLDKQRPCCTKYLKDEAGMLKSGELESETIEGQHIFKHGAASDLTTGIVCSNDYTLADGGDNYLVVIAPPPAGTFDKYAYPGDSGSVNCIADVENNRTVKVVSMLSAGDMKLEDMDESMCLSFILAEGLDKLRNMIGGIDLKLSSINNQPLYY